MKSGFFIQNEELTRARQKYKEYHAMNNEMTLCVNIYSSPFLEIPGQLFPLNFMQLLKCGSIEQLCFSNFLSRI